MQEQSVKLHRPVKYYTECYAYITYRFGRLTEGVRYGIILNEIDKKFYKWEFKKVLALVLAFACAFTMFAGAAFTEQADIKVDSDVVDTLVSLGVINGYTDGSFKPNDTVTRAEMAKMIYVLRTGNSDASAYNNDPTTFADIKGHWAAGYIKYCQSLGIIAGQSATKFAPDQTVTAQEAAKMLLVTLGYNADKAGLVGINWASTTNALADENGLLEDVNTSFTAACPRQYAAQLIYNAIFANTVVLRDGEYTNMNLLGTDKLETVGEKYMGLKKTVGTLAYVAKTSGKDTYELTINPVNKNDPSAKCESSFTKVAKDYSALKYNTVKVLYKAKDNVYGVFATDDNTSNTGVLADLKNDENDKKVKLNDTKYDLADNTTVYIDGYKINDDIKTWVAANEKGNTTNEKGSKVELLATNGSSNYSILNVTIYSVEKVTYVGKDYVTLDKTGKKSDDEYNYYSDIKKDNYVVVSKAGNYADKKGLIEKATVVEGKIDSTKTNSKNAINKVQIGGEWYSTNVATTGDNALKLGSSVKLVLVNKYIYKIDKVTTVASDVALLVEAGSTSGVSSKHEARLIFADGTDKVVETKKYWEDDSNKGPIGEIKISAKPILVTYDVSKNVYTLTKITKDDTAGYDKFVELTDATIDGSATGTVYNTSSDTSINKVYFESTGIVFVRQDAGTANDDPSFKVVTGKTAANWDVKTKKANIQAVADETNKNVYAQVAVVDFGANKASGSSDKTYAVALGSSYLNKDGGTTYTMVKAWNGTEEKTYKYEGTKSIKAGDLFEYSADGEDTVDIDVVATRAANSAKVVSYENGTGDIVTDPATTLSKSKIDSKDTVVLYVDSEAGAGVGSGKIRQANKYNKSSDKDVANVLVFSEKNEDQITVIVVDVNNDYTAW